VVLAGRPAVFPVNYALDGDAVVFRTAPGTKLEAISRSLVAFQVDCWAPSGTGWSVVVEGFAQEVTSADAPGLRERLAALPLRPWAPGDRLHFVRIVPFTITGARLHPTTNGNGGH
jgi:nitroimidazol reductase NimA-like FMN-containing flavoprotein (pyridoxamine 5'-phosphate oxidase superfamily)